jgi:hypothetical protein
VELLLTARAYARAAADASPPRAFPALGHASDDRGLPFPIALVSAVMYNRLAADMPLAIDATLRYGLLRPQAGQAPSLLYCRCR